MYPILASGYDGRVRALIFEPPSTLKVVHCSAQSEAGGSPSWIAAHTDGADAVFVTSEEEDGKVYILSPRSILQQDQSTSKALRTEAPTTKGGYSTHGSAPVASCIVKSHLYIANYTSGSAAVLKLKGKDDDYAPDTTTEPTLFHFKLPNGTQGPVTARQDKSYAHDAVASPDGGWVYISDLGTDQIHHIKTASDGNAAQFTASTSVASGSGPRHIAFYKDEEEQYAYLASELSNTLTAFAHDSQSGRLDKIGQPISTTPQGTRLGGSRREGPDRSVAEVAISPDGRFVYVSNRGDDQEDHVSIFKRDAKTGSVAFQEWTGSGGRGPRHFSLSFDGKYAVVANQRSGNIVVFARDAQSGRLEQTGARVDDLGQVAFAGFVRA